MVPKAGGLSYLICLWHVTPLHSFFQLSWCLLHIGFARRGHWDAANERNQLNASEPASEKLALTAQVTPQKASHSTKIMGKKFPKPARWLHGPPICSPVVDLQEGQVGLGGDLPLLVLCGVGVLEKKEMGQHNDIPVCKKAAPSGKKKISTPPSFSFSHPSFGGLLHLKDARLKGGIWDHHGLPAVPRAFPRLSIKGFSLKEVSIFCFGDFPIMFFW